MSTIEQQQAEIISKVQTIVDSGKSAVFAGVDQRLQEDRAKADAQFKQFEERVFGAIKGVAGNFKFGQSLDGQNKPDGHAAPTPLNQVRDADAFAMFVKNVSSSLPTLVQQTKPTLLSQMGITNPYKPATVGVSKNQGLGALAMLATPAVATAREMAGEAGDIATQAMLGLAAFGLEQAHKKGLVEVPRKGMGTLEIVALTLAGTAVAGGAVAGGMYLAEVGPFKKSE